MLTDRLKRPIKVGDTVITQYYSSPTFGIITKVVKVNKSKVVIELPHKIYCRRYTADGKWEYTTREVPTLARYPSQMIVVNEQLAYNQANFPEVYL